MSEALAEGIQQETNLKILIEPIISGGNISKELITQSRCKVPEFWDANVKKVNR